MKSYLIPFFLLILQVAFGQDQTAKINDYVSSYVKSGDFSGCILITAADDILYKNCFGNANDSTGTLNKESTKFLIGSISKQFTAAAILLLEEDGLINVQNNISEYFPNIPIAEKITIHQLLTHSSGVTDIFNIKGLKDLKREDLNIGGLSKIILREELNFEPGSGYSYSNGGYAILAYIIEAVSKLSYGEFMKQRIFEPLEMNHTGHANVLESIEDRAIGYDPIGYDRRMKATLLDTEFLKGSGSLYSTNNDLNIWIQSLKFKSFLSPVSYDKFFKNHGANYGYGVSLYSTMDRDVFGHDGRISGYIADYLHYKEDDISIIILGNIQTGTADFFRRDLAAIIFEKPYSTRVKTAQPALQSPIDVSLLEGVYAFGPNFKVYIDYFDKRIMARANQGAYSELVPLTDSRFFSRTLYSFIAFRMDESGKVEKMIWTNNDGNAFEGIKE
ncbi:MAG: beta-lactamase family protein [Flavobacteriaceae bacterium]|nr:beta-lactamase family protein [Flavobacteriaceae bacterium]